MLIFLSLLFLFVVVGDAVVCTKFKKMLDREKQEFMAACEKTHASQHLEEGDA